MSLENKLEQIIEREVVETPEQLSFTDKLKYGVRNYLIDTSAKVGCYAPIMAAMEAYNGLDSDQILQSRATAALIDAGIARVYGKVLDKIRKMFKAEKSKIRDYLVDTATMVGVYSPLYAVILAAAGADAKQIGGALLMGAGISAVTARPFGKYVLDNWRKIWGHSKNETANTKKNQESEPTAQQMEEYLLRAAELYFPRAKEIKRYKNCLTGTMDYEITYGDNLTGDNCVKYLRYNMKIEEKYAHLLPPLENKGN